MNTPLPFHHDQYGAITMLGALLVLAIFGAILAVSLKFVPPAMQQSRVNTFSQSLMQVRNNIEAAYRLKPSYDGLDTASAIADGLVPESLQTPVAGAYVSFDPARFRMTPWRGAWDVRTTPSSAGTNDLFAFDVFMRDPKVCAAMVHALAPGAVWLAAGGVNVASYLIWPDGAAGYGTKPVGGAFDARVATNCAKVTTNNVLVSRVYVAY